MSDLAPKKYYYSLDALRGIAAILVVFWHGKDILVRGIRPASGYLAVDLFFVLSGFVIANAYHNRFLSGLTFSEFVKQRMVRLYPAFIASVAFSFFFIVVAIRIGKTDNWTLSQAISALLPNLFFLPSVPNNIDAPLYPLNVPGWSLFFEIAANMAFVLLWRKNAWLTLGLIGLGAIALVWLSLSDGSVNFGHSWNELHAGIARVVFSFLLGTQLWRIHRRGIPKGVAGVFAALTVMAMIVPVSEGLRPFFDLACVLTVFPAAIYFLAAGEWKASSPPSPVFVPVAKFLGGASYPLYVFHVPLLGVYSKLVVPRLAGVSDFEFLLIGFAFLAAVVTGSWLFEILIDAPLRRMAHRKLRRYSPNPA